MSRIIPSLSKMWHKVINLESTLFPALQESLRLEAFSHKEQKLIKILDFAQIEENVTVVNITNPPKDREEIARAFIAKSVYNIQTTRDLIDRLHIDRTLRILCGWRYKSDIPSESKFSRVFKELSKQAVAQKTHEKFIATYLKEKIFFYNAKESSQRVAYLYDLQDAGYDADIIREVSQSYGHQPIIDINPKNSKVLKEKIALKKHEKKVFKALNLHFNLDTQHYNQRSMVERVNKYLKDDFGCDKIYYQGAKKVASVLAFGILSICIHQSLKLVT